MKNILLIALLFISNYLTAQPQYIYPATGGGSASAIPLGTLSTQQPNNKAQYIYEPGQLNIPEGYVTSVYYRVGGATVGSYIFPYFYLGIGNTQQDSFTITTTPDTALFLTGLNYTLLQSFTAVPVNLWVQVPLAAPFYYSGGSNLAIELAASGVTSWNQGQSILGLYSGVDQKSCYGGYAYTMGKVQGKQAFIGFDISQPLSINLTQFGITKQGNNVVLHWQTSSTAGIDHFIIERSTTGILFDSIGSASATTTSFVDNLPNSSKKYYYRLNVVELNGSHSFSQVLQITTAKARYGSMSDNFSIQNDSHARISDLNGKIFFDGSYNGTLTRLVKSLDLPTGFYVMKAESADCSQSYKFFKN